MIFLCKKCLKITKMEWEVTKKKSKGTAQKETNDQEQQREESEARQTRQEEVKIQQTARRGPAYNTKEGKTREVPLGWELGNRHGRR